MTTIYSPPIVSVTSNFEMIAQPCSFSGSTPLKLNTLFNKTTKALEGSADFLVNSLDEDMPVLPFHAASLPDFIPDLTLHGDESEPANNDDLLASDFEAYTNNGSFLDEAADGVSGSENDNVAYGYCPSEDQPSDTEPEESDASPQISEAAQQLQLIKKIEASSTIPTPSVSSDISSDELTDDQFEDLLSSFDNENAPPTPKLISAPEIRDSPDHSLPHPPQPKLEVLSSKVRLRVEDIDPENYLIFNCHLDKPLDSVIKKSCRKFGRSQKLVRFLFDGHRVCLTDTPDKLHMGSEETIGVFIEQSGGGFQVASEGLGLLKRGHEGVDTSRPRNRRRIS